MKLKLIAKSLVNAEHVPFVVAGLPGGTQKFQNVNELIHAMEKAGYKKSGVNKTGRSELHGLPTFFGLYGPMYNGEDSARYETKQEYLSND